MRLGRPTSATVNRTACWPPATRSASGAWCGAEHKRPSAPTPSAAGRAPAFTMDIGAPLRPALHRGIIMGTSYSSRARTPTWARPWWPAPCCWRLAARGIAAPGTNRCRRAAPDPEGLRNLDAFAVAAGGHGCAALSRSIPMPSEPPIAPISPPVSEGEHPRGAVRRLAGD